ncbi:hypothetical protein ABI59_20835 [Acidobacteria bacterium Mor1]|nr:hypothetical protein ABI59_20835 [Acidobacteria bacterium Mor1]
MVLLGRPFGEQLKSWRSARGLSQLDLGLHARVSARHISFLETGRAQPSREMVVRLARALDLPLRERNTLLEQAGFAPLYGERPLDDAALGSALDALGFLLRAHDPNPAIVLDRYWTVLRWNRSHERLVAALVAGESAPQGNALDWVFEPGPVRERIVNWSEVAGAVLTRLRRQVQRAATDERLRQVWDRVLAAPGVAELAARNPLADPQILVPLRLRIGGEEYAWVNTLAVFGAAGEATLEDLVVETFFPADEPTRRFMKQLSGDGEIPPPA